MPPYGSSCAKPPRLGGRTSGRGAAPATNLNHRPMLVIGADFVARRFSYAVTDAIVRPDGVPADGHKQSPLYQSGREFDDALQDRLEGLPESPCDPRWSFRAATPSTSRDAPHRGPAVITLIS
jgi:hypothetical protein